MSENRKTQFPEKRKKRFDPRIIGERNMIFDNKKVGKFVGARVFLLAH